uniref:Putative low molecular weight protein-tyrosine-phosphatase slr0328 n=1 Tax=Rhizophora mucronata TaxID=61149 RepID=A0A2P2JQ15_RHIMU
MVKCVLHMSLSLVMGFGSLCSGYIGGL